MSFQEAVESALANLGAHKLRSLLTMLGMIFGVGAVIAMLAIGAGAERQALDMIERLGLRNVLVRSVDLDREELQEVRKKSLGVSLRDAAAIAEAVPQVELVAPRVRVKPYRVLAAGAKAEAQVYGVSHLHAGLADLTLAEGRFLDPLDERRHEQVCVLGAAVRRDLFGFGPAVGERVKINDVWLRVVGVLAPVEEDLGSGAAGEGAAGGAGGAPGGSMGGSMGGAAVSGGAVQGVSVGSPSRQILMPVTTAQRKFYQDPLESPLDEVVVRLREDASAATTAAVIDELLDRLHSGARDYELVVPEALLAQSRRTQRLFNLVMGAIAGISLLVGGIGIMNIMLATVLERTREIGVRRAVGARRRDIQFQFVMESFTISLLGGLAGVAAGVGLAWGVAAWAGWETVVTAPSIVLATGVAVTVGLVSGIYPAHRAAQLDPIEALRYE